MDIFASTACKGRLIPRFEDSLCISDLMMINFLTLDHDRKELDTNHLVS